VSLVERVGVIGGAEEDPSYPPSLTVTFPLFLSCSCSYIERIRRKNASSINTALSKRQNGFCFHYLIDGLLKKVGIRPDRSVVEATPDIALEWFWSL
jgi:hypothetical protein